MTVHLVSHEVQRTACGVSYATALKNPNRATEDHVLITCERCNKAVEKFARLGEMMFTPPNRGN